MPWLRRFVPLRRIARRHRAQLQQVYRAVFAANLFCVSGALFGGFTALHAALISNSATSYVYFHQCKWLNDLIVRMDLKRRSDIHTEADDEFQDDEASIAVNETEPGEEFLDESIADETPI